MLIFEQLFMLQNIYNYTIASQQNSQTGFGA